MLRVLRSGGRATLLLRNPDTVTSNAEFQALTDEQRERAVIVKGDAYIREDVARAVDAAGPDMDTIVFTMGANPSKFSVSRGLILDPPQPCARGIMTLLSVLQDQTRPATRLVIVSTMGLGEKHKEVPFLIRGWMYGWLLYDAHTDKEALEYISLRASKHPTPPHQPSDAAMPEAAASLRSDWLDSLVIVRPALYTDGKETDVARAGVSLRGAYYISRRDVGKFVAEQCLKGSDEWVGEEGVVLAY